MLLTPSDVWGQRFRITRAKPVQARGLKGGGGIAFTKHPDYWKKVSCKEYNCKNYQRGWVTTLSMSPMQNPDDLLMNQARYNYIRNNSERAFDEKWDGSEVKFHFPAEQECFQQHLLPIERDPVFIRNKSQLDFDQFFDEYNETNYRLGQVRKAG